MFGLKRRLRTFLSSALDAVIIPENEMIGWSEASYAQRLFRKLDVDCVFDVGANRGQFGTWLRAVGFEGIILSFEPNPSPFEDLAKVTATDRNWRCFQYALGDREENLSFNVMALDVFSSFLKPTADKSLGYCDENNVVTKLKVPVHPLDRVYRDIRREARFQRPFLKMDTQGYDLQVVAGAKSCISDFAGMLSEVAFRPLYENAPAFEESLRAFRAAGFELSGLFPVHPENTLNLHEMNAYCVRADLLGPETV